MTDQHAVYTPPAGYRILAPLYDIGVRLSTREKRWRSDLVDLIEPKCNEVLLDIGAGLPAAWRHYWPRKTQPPRTSGSIQTKTRSRSHERKRGELE